MAIGGKLRIEPLRSLAFGSMGATYVPVGTPTEHPASLMVIQNFTDAYLMFAFNDHTDHIPLSPGGSFTIDVTANKPGQVDLMITAGTHVHVKNLGTPTTGSVYVTTLYGATR